MKTLLAEIEGYLLFHFDSEEHLMRHYGYPRFAEHQSVIRDHLVEEPDQNQHKTGDG